MNDSIAPVFRATVYSVCCMHDQVP
jgi:hypothetical protein